MKKSFNQLTTLFFSGMLVSASSLSAQSEDSILSSVFFETGSGYLMDTEEPYYFGRIGLDRGCGNKFFFSYSRLDHTLFSGTEGGISGKAEESISTFALGATFGFPVGDNGNFFYGFDVGVASVEEDIFVSDGIDSVNLSFDDNVLYASVTMGIEHRFTENLSLVGQVRYIYLDDYEFDLGGGAKVFLEDDQQFSFELALKFNF